VLVVFVGVILWFRFSSCGKKSQASVRELGVWDEVRRVWAVYKVPNKIKIVLGFYMITVKVGTIYEVELPDEIKAILAAISVPLSLGVDIFTSSLDCIGLGGYFLRLLFYIVAPAGLFAVIFLAVAVGLPREERTSCTAVLLAGLPPVLKCLFFVYPVVNTIAFQAFPCIVFDRGEAFESSWLIADVAVQCDDPASYGGVLGLAWLAVVLYPIGALVVCGTLLMRARHAILRDDPSDLSEALAFLYKEYKPDFFWWELMEMGRKFLLVGVFVVVSPGTVLQIFLATLVSAIYLFIQLQAYPYKSLLDNFLAATTSAAILVVFLCAIIYKYIALTSEPELQAKMTKDQEEDYLPPVVLLSLVVGVGILGSLAVTFGLLVVKAMEERGAFNRMFQDVTTGLMNKKRFEAVKSEIEAVAKQGKETVVSRKEARKARVAAAAKGDAATAEHLPDPAVKVPTFLRVGASHDWELADKCETGVRAEIYKAAFGDLQARGAICAHDDPKIANVSKWATTWDPADAASMAEVVKELKANGGTIYISCDIQGFKAVNDRIDHTAGDNALVWYGALMKMVCAKTNRQHKKLFEAMPFRTGGDEVAAICRMHRAKADDAEYARFATAALQFVKMLAQVQVEAPVPMPPSDKKMAIVVQMDGMDTASSTLDKVSV